MRGMIQEATELIERSRFLSDLAARLVRFWHLLASAKEDVTWVQRVRHGPGDSCAPCGSPRSHDNAVRPSEVPPAHRVNLPFHRRSRQLLGECRSLEDASRQGARR